MRRRLPADAPQRDDAPQRAVAVPQRIVLVRLSHLGDVVHALPVFHALRARWPDAALGWAVQSEFAGLVRGLPGLDATFAFERRGGARAWLRLWRALRSFRPDLAVDAQGNLKSAAATWGSGAPRRVGLARVDWQERPAALALTESAPPAAGPHAMHRMLALARHLGADPGAPRTDPALDPAERAAGAALADELLGTGDAVLLHLAAQRDVRAWPPASFGALARLLLDAGRPVLVLGGPAEEDEARTLEAQLGPRAGLAWWHGTKDLRLLAALFAAAGERGARLVGCDSGPMHLAAASGLPVVLLAGPRDPARTGPWPTPDEPGSPHRVVRTPEPPDCEPCLSARCRHLEGAVCMSGIAPARVLAALDPVGS